MSQLNVTLVGHSYVRRLRDYRRYVLHCQNELVVDQVKVGLKYVFRGGRDYYFFNRSRRHKRQILRGNPDVILVVLGGNAVANSKPIPEATQEMRVFIQWLREMMPHVIIIVAEVEQRYSWNPLLPRGYTGESFRERRNAFNKAILRVQMKDCTMRIANCLCQRNYYDRKGVHLSQLGNDFYWQLIHNVLKYVIDTWFGASPK